MAIDCGRLSLGIKGYDCENPPVQGVKPRALLVNMDDIDRAKTKSEDGIITDIILKTDGVTNRYGYWAETLDPGISVNVALVKGTYLNAWEHKVMVRLFENSPKVKQFIEDLEKARIVVIIENRYVKTDVTAPEVIGETVYEAYGWGSGLKLMEATRDSTDADTRGGWVLSLGNDETSKEPRLPVTIFKTDLTVTQEMIESLAE